jgi:phospholipid/cholesterol/gamma-HCH transport system permease protein
VVELNKHFEISSELLVLRGHLVLRNVERIESPLKKWIEKSADKEATIDLETVESIDSSGVALLDDLVERAEKRGLMLNLVNIPEHLQGTFKIFSSAGLTRKAKSTRIFFFEKLGGRAYAAIEELINVLYLVADSFYFSIANLFSRKGARKGEYTTQCILIGMNAFPIVALISFLIGFILALQSAAQLRQFGASIFVADLISISMTREMGPLMTAIIFAGRSGSAIAAELATMVVTEETDALKAMGLNPVRYNLVPKIHAISTMMPLLTILSMVLGILGSLLIGVVYLGIGVKPFMMQAINALILKDILTGLVKSIVFAWLIVITSAAYGLRVRGGAADVGRATTASVVTSIFLVILADSVLGLLFYFSTKSPF